MIGHYTIRAQIATEAIVIAILRLSNSGQETDRVTASWQVLSSAVR